MFRIGGDEFVMLTASEDIAYAEDICKRIKAYNGQPIVYEGQEIPLNLYIGTVKFDGEHIRYKDLYDQLHSQILEYKK